VLAGEADFAGTSISSQLFWCWLQAILCPCLSLHHRQAHNQEQRVSHHAAKANRKGRGVG